MARTNLTIQLDADVIRRARVVAARRGTSVSALAAQQIVELVEVDARFVQARDRADAILLKATPRGGRHWTRDELHDREALRGR